MGEMRHEKYVWHLENVKGRANLDVIGIVGRRIFKRDRNSVGCLCIGSKELMIRARGRPL
jgi:hypothetical protein